MDFHGALRKMCLSLHAEFGDRGFALLACNGGSKRVVLYNTRRLDLQD